MSKEIAQTVGGKRIAWLLAILAAFALVATLSTTMRGASAMAEADVAITVTQSPAGPNVAAGSAATLTISAAFAADTLNASLEFNPDDDFAVTAASFALAPSGSTGNCTAIADGDPNNFVCTLGAMDNGSTATITVTGTVNNDVAAFANGDGNNTGANNEILVRSGPADTTPADDVDTPNAGYVVIAAAANTLTKTHAPGSLGQAGGAYTSTIIFTNTEAVDVDGTTITITDQIPAGVSVTAVAVAGATFITAPTIPANCGATLPLVGPATLSCTVTFAATEFDAGDSITLTVTNSATATLAPRTLTNTAGVTATIGGVVLNDTQPDSINQAGAIIAELRHMSDVANTVITGREVSINVRNSRHTICAVQQNTGLPAIDWNNDGDFLDANEAAVPAVAAQLPGLTLANIQVTNGGGYATTIDTDPTFSDVRIFIGDGNPTGRTDSTTTAGLSGATCISWVSLDAGDQSISIVYVDPVSGLNVSAHWDTDGDANDHDGVANDGTPNTTLVKEWNRLEDSTLTLTGAVTGSVTGTNTATPPTGSITKNISVVLDPATGLYRLTPLSSVTITDIFRGSHTNSAGQKEGPGVVSGDPSSDQFANGLAGVNWTAALAAGSCGDLGGTLSGVTLLGSDGKATDYPSLTFTAGNAAATNCGPGRTATINFTGSEPGPLGSGTGTIVTESVTFTFTTEVAAKQVFLAWAGQRVILEHDWRIPAGDQDGDATNGPDPIGQGTSDTRTIDSCPFTGSFSVTYIRGSGPGNFLPSLGANISGNDQAIVSVADDDSQSFANDDDIVGDANGSCISRVLYESEDQGQVDIEAFVSSGNNNLNVTKHAFVIYYMKINTINVSLATQFSKPSHNSSNRTIATQGGPADATHYADWATGTAAPTNPWDASLDDADNAAEWNVSKDLLVRGRVTGWFTNSNPSGRARDDSNPLNVLPADRWVMPNDWPLLAGGPADPADGSDAIGTAEQFRPYYDIMFAPNNARGIALTTPEGNAAVQVATVVAAATNTATSFAVSSCVSLPANANIWVGSSSTARVVVSCTSSVLTINLALGAAPAAGTPVFLVTGVPFEGPFSLLDIKGFAAEGKGGAALSDFDPGNIRDTSKEDGDVDMWDAPMPPAPVSVQIRGTGFIKEVIKDEIYYLGTPNSALQTYPNPFYIQDIPDSPFIPAIVVGGGYFWDTWGPDGPGGLGQGVYRFWTPAIIGTNSAGVPDSFTSGQTTELNYIRTAYGDNTIARDLVLYTDNHGEFMVAANGDYRTDLTACATNVLAGGKHCKPGDKVGTGTITATVDYPDFRGKHFPVLSNAAKVDWTWGGYKDVTVEDGETDQFKYIVFHGMDRDGFCNVPTGAVSLHPVYSAAANDSWTGIAVYPPETIDFLIDSGEGIIIEQSGVSGTINDGKQFATGLKTFSLAVNNPAVAPKSDTTGNKEFDLSPLAAEGQTDECQAWIKVSNSLLGVINILAIAHDDEGNIGFDRVIDLTNTHSYTLTFRWSLITWVGADAISVNDAIKGTGDSGQNPGGNDISASVTAIYGWDAAAQQWLGFFPSGVNVPGANDLTALSTGDAYWVAITGPSSVTWTVASNVN